MGESKFNNLGVDWGVSHSKVKSVEDNRRQLVYLYNDGKYRINDIDILDNHRFSSYLNETELSTRLNLNYTLKKVRFDVGYDYKNKVRDFDYDQNIYDFNDADLMNDITLPETSSFNFRATSESSIEFDILKNQSLNDAFSALNELGAEIQSIRPKNNRLEEVFVDLVKGDNQ